MTPPTAGSPPNASARKYNLRAYDGFPIRYWDHWLDDRQIRLFVQPADASAPARDPAGRH